MKRVIFTCYDDLQDKDDKFNNLTFQQNQIKDYFDRLIENKAKYAEHIGAQFIFYHNQMSNYVLDDVGLEFTKANLYKHYLMAELAQEYDEVMYIDMDVIFNTKKNVFEELDLSKGIHVRDQDDEVRSKINKEVLLSQIGNRSATIKYHITKDMLGGRDCHVMNTGIMIGKSEHIKLIKFQERIKGLIEKIYDIEKDTFLRMYYYPNNESIFSYILEEYNIPYVLMEERWHTLIEEDPKHLDWNEIEIAHFLNKKFNAFFNDKTKCIYSLYIQIPDERLDNPVGPSDDTVNKSKRTQERLAKYKDNLLFNHALYAEKIGAEYKHFERDDEYEQFFERFPNLSEYDVVNLYKVYLLDKLTKEYDLVLYVDFDVYFTTYIDVFNHIKGEHCFACKAETATDTGIFVSNEYWKEYNRDFRSPHTKYWNAHALLTNEDFDGDNLVFNTGIMMASKKVMEQIDYFSDIDEVLDTMTELKEFSMYPDKVQSQFGYDNETIMGYKVAKNNVPVHRLSDTFHYRHYYTTIKTFDNTTQEYRKEKHILNAKIKEHNVQLVHFISKNFGLVFDS